MAPRPDHVYSARQLCCGFTKETRRDREKRRRCKFSISRGSTSVCVGRRAADRLLLTTAALAHGILLETMLYSESRCMSCKGSETKKLLYMVPPESATAATSVRPINRSLRRIGVYSFCDRLLLVALVVRDLPFEAARAFQADQRSCEIHAKHGQEGRRARRVCQSPEASSSYATPHSRSWKHRTHSAAGHGTICGPTGTRMR